MPDDASLRSYLEVVKKTSTNALESLGVAFEHIEKVDSLFLDCMPRLGKIQPSTAGVLVLNAHACFRAAIGSALSGQLLPTYMALRGALESALYANAMAQAQDLARVWLERGKDAEAHDLCRKSFSFNAVLGKLKEAQGDVFAVQVNEIYAALIDFGAHPNTKSLISSTDIEETPAGHALTFAYVHGPGSLEARQSLVACAETGNATFLIVLVALTSSAALDDLKDLNDRALALQDTAQFVKQLGLLQPDVPK